MVFDIFVNEIIENTVQSLKLEKAYRSAIILKFTNIQIHYGLKNNETWNIAIESTIYMDEQIIQNNLLSSHNGLWLRCG